jgi:hypothetical protein
LEKESSGAGRKREKKIKRRSVLVGTKVLYGLYALMQADLGRNRSASSNAVAGEGTGWSKVKRRREKRGKGRSGDKKRHRGEMRKGILSSTKSGYYHLQNACPPGVKEVSKIFTSDLDLV